MITSPRALTTVQLSWDQGSRQVKQRQNAPPSWQRGESRLLSQATSRWLINNLGSNISDARENLWHQNMTSPRESVPLRRQDTHRGTQDVNSKSLASSHLCNLSSPLSPPQSPCSFSLSLAHLVARLHCLIEVMCKYTGAKKEGDKGFLSMCRLLACFKRDENTPRPLSQKHCFSCV